MGGHVAYGRGGGGEVHTGFWLGNLRERHHLEDLDGDGKISFSKIFEKAIYIRLAEYLTNTKILTDSQYGFRKGLATEDAILKLTSEILNSQNNKTKLGSVFCDLQKAFDTVTPSQAALLLNKRESK